MPRAVVDDAMWFSIEESRVEHVRETQMLIRIVLLFR